MPNSLAAVRPDKNKARMLLWLLALPLVLVPTGGKTSAPAHHAGVSVQPARVVESYGKLPLAFEANQGQSDSQVKFLSRSAGYSLFLTNSEAVLTLRKVSRQEAALRSAKPLPVKHPPAQQTTQEKPSVLRMKLLGANADTQVTGQDQLPGKSNYFLGNDPKKWHTNVPQYAKVRYANIYPGVDLVYYGNQRQLEYDFIVAPGADPRRIAFDVSGAKQIRRDARGDLVLKLSEGEIRWHKPVVYQEKDGAQQLVAARYAVTENNRVRFELGKHDASRVLYIDPLIYSTYLGGSDDDAGFGIAADSTGNAYVIGTTSSTDFPTTPGAFQTKRSGYNFDDVFVAKIDATGSGLVYSSYLGGSNGDIGYAIAVDSAGNAYVTGVTYSFDFPVTAGAFQTTCANCNTAFATKINATGSALVYSTYLGGSVLDIGRAIAVDSAGNAYVAGDTESSDFPTTPGALQTSFGGGDDAFVTKINPGGSALVYSTYLGGSNSESCWGIAVDSAANAFLAGSTNSTNFPVTPGAFQTTFGGGSNDAFVTKINPQGSALVYSTYLGGSSSDSEKGIALDSGGNAYVTGATESANFPITPGALETICNGGRSNCSMYNDIFVTKLNPLGSALIYSTYLGGRNYDVGTGIAVDGAGSAYVTGYTVSTDFPVTTGAFQKKYGGNDDAFVSRINSSGSALLYSTYLGGTDANWGWNIAVQSAGNAYVIGNTRSTDFPITPGAFQTTCNGGSGCNPHGDAFVSKVDVRPVPVITLSSSVNPVTYGQAVTFTARMTSVLGAPPDGETITFKKGTTVLGTGTLSAGSASFTTSSLTGGTDSIQAVYGGDANLGPSTSKPLKQVVNKATSTTTLTSSLNSSNYGQAVTFTAKVMPQFSGTVKGTVTFYDGTTALATKALSGGTAKFTTSTLTQGAHTITATYNGNVNFLGSSASITQTVN